MAVTLHVGSFEGPLDLLLYLVGREKIDIREIFVSQVTQQYIRLIAEAPDLNMEEASDFIRMAATLLEMKVRSLLPKPPPVPDEESPEDALIRQLQEYAVFKELAQKIQTLEEDASRMHTKLPEEFPLPPPRMEFTGLTLEGLMNAFSALLARASGAREPEKDSPRSIVMDAHAVPGCMARILRRLRVGPCSLADLLGTPATREEVITLFLAMLELLRLGRLSVRQENSFGDIRILPAPGREKEAP